VVALRCRRRVAEFQVVVEGNKSDLQKGNSENNALKAQLAVGSRAASRSADCSACDFHTAGDRSAHLELNPSVQTELSDSSNLRTVHGVNDGNCNMHYASGSHAS